MKLLFLPFAFVAASSFACPGDAAKSAGMIEAPASVAAAPAKVQRAGAAMAVKANETKAVASRVAVKSVEARKSAI